MHIAYLARAENELVASVLEDELRFVRATISTSTGYLRPIGAGKNQNATPAPLAYNADGVSLPSKRTGRAS
jgi:hypothetical protein